MSTSKDLSAYVARLEAKAIAKPAKATALEAKLDAKIASLIAKGKTVVIDGATVTSYNLDTSGSSGGGSGGGSTTGATVTLTADTQNQNFSSYSSAVVTVDGDDDAVEGDEFSVTLTSGADTLVPDTWLRLDANGGDGVDTLDLRNIGKDGVDADEADVNLQTGVAHPDMDATFTNFENVYASELGGRLVGTTGNNTFYLGEATDDIEAAGGDDTIIAEDADLLDAADDLDGGSGTDTLTVDGEDTVNFDTAVDVLTNIENIKLTGTGDDDTTLSFGNLFNSTNTTTGVVGGITNIQVVDAGDEEGHTVNITSTATAAANDVNLIGVTFSNITTLVIDAGDGNDIRIDSNSLAGVSELDGIAGENLVLKGGSYDLSGVEFTDLTELDGSGSSNDTVTLGLDNGNLADIDGGASAGDVVTFANTDVGDLSAYTNISDFESLTFGTASSVILDHANGTGGAGTMFSSIAGTSSDSDTLTFVNDAAVTLTNTTITAVESVVIDNAGTAVDLTIGASTFASGVVVIGDSAATDEVILGANSVDVSTIDFRDFEWLDFNSRTATISVSTFSGFDYVDGSTGVLTFSDSGAITLSTNGEDHTAGGARYQFASGDDSLTLVNFDDNAVAVDMRLGEGADTVTLSGTGNTLSGSLISLEGGNDTFVTGTSVDTASGVVSGGEGTDTIKTTDVAIADGDLALADYVGFESIVFGAASTANLSIQLDSDNDAAGITSIDYSLDTSATGTNTMDLDGWARAMTIVGSAGRDDINTGTNTTSVDGGAGGDFISVTGSSLTTAAEAKTFTITGGAGTDDFTILGNAHNDATGSDTIVITDYTTGEDIDIGTAASLFNPVATPAAQTDVIEMEQSVAQAIVNGSSADGLPGSLTVALNRLSNYVFTADAANDILVTAFQYGGDTYLYVDGSAGFADYSSAQDFYVKLTGLKTVQMTDIFVDIV